MITIKQIEERMLAARADEAKKAEELIDKELEAAWSRGERKIPVFLPGIHRLVLDKVAARYRAANDWTVEYMSSGHNSTYDGLVFTEYRARPHSEL